MTVKHTIEWFIKSDNKSFGVSAKAWFDGSRWNWNVYARIYSAHPLFNKPSKAKNLPFHGGCTFDEIRTSIPSEGIVYEWQKEVKILVVGSDYAHICDDYENHPSGLEGVPCNILSDANELADALLKELDDE